MEKCRSGVALSVTPVRLPTLGFSLQASSCVCKYHRSSWLTSTYMEPTSAFKRWGEKVIKRHTIDRLSRTRCSPTCPPLPQESNCTPTYLPGRATTCWRLKSFWSGAWHYNTEFFIVKWGSGEARGWKMKSAYEFCLTNKTYFLLIELCFDVRTPWNPEPQLLS